MKVFKDIKMKWCLDYYDGPLSGICEIDDRHHYFKFIQESVKSLDDICSNVRVYGIYQLTDKEIERETYWHDEFRKWVGTHTDYNEEVGARNLGGVKPRDGMHNFYDRKDERDKDRPELTTNKLVGIWIVHEMG